MVWKTSGCSLLLMTPIKNILIFAIICLASFLPAQSPQMQMLTVADGLSQGFITALYQDRQGFLWIGTLDGLNRYDGYSIRRFNRQPFTPFSLSNSAYITFIIEDREGLFWIGTYESLYVFDPATERFHNISYQTKVNPSQGFASIAMDSKGNIMVHMPGKEDSIGLFRIITPPNFVQQIRYGKEPLAGVRAERLTLPAAAQAPFRLEPCVGDTLFLVRDNTGRGFRLELPDFHAIPFDLLNIRSSDPSILWSNQYGFFFRRRSIGSEWALMPPFEFRGVIRLKEGTCLSNRGADNVLYRIRSEMPLTSDMQALMEMNQAFYQDFTPFLTFPHKISIIFGDRSDMIWVGTGGYGLHKINLNHLSFHHILKDTSLYNLRQLPNGRIWGGKIYSNLQINLTTGQLEAAPWASFFKGKTILNLLPDRSGNMWFITSGKPDGSMGGIFLWEKVTGRYRKIAPNPAYKDMIAEQLLEDHNGDIWIAAHDGHLFQYHQDKGHLNHYNFSDALGENNKNLTSNAILEDQDGVIWIGTSRGLLAMHRQQDGSPASYQIYQHEDENLQTIAWNWVLCIYQDRENPQRLWVGTRGGGINCLDKRSGHFTHFTEANGLSDNVVYGIVPDDDGNLWCSTNRGLSRFSPSTGTFINYNESNGLQNNEFNTGAYLRNSDGTMFFGGVNGLTYFNPPMIKMNTQVPPIAFTGIQVQGKTLMPATEGSPLQFAPQFQQTLTLPFSQNNVTFEFAALDFANPATNRYRYKMQGIDHDWIHSGNTHSANYVSLPPGKYTFQVQAATAEGDWNPQSAHFELEILPPWYRSGLAYFFYLILFGGLAFRFISFRETRLREQHTMQLKQQESDRLKELDSFKNRLFANITHEFRTPLTIILGLAERMRRGERKEETKGNAGHIISQGTNLLDLVNQMLDLAKLESHGLTLYPTQGNISAFVRHHAESFLALAQHKDVSLTITTEEPDLVMDFDPQRFRQILGNLLANAIRHTSSGGNVAIHLFSKSEQEAILVVADTGEGIEPGDLPYVFDRFYQGHSLKHNQGTSGIGLAFTRELIILAGGEIRVDSIPGQGTTFTVNLPITRQAVRFTVDGASALPPQGLLQQAEKHPHSSALPLLLIMEDNLMVADYLRLCLREHYQLAVAADGEQGIQMAFERIPDLIITDVMMPKKNGFEVTEILNQDERTSHIPVVILTAKTQMDDRLEGLRRGANAYLTKPFNDQELLLLLQNQLKLQQKWQQRYAILQNGIPVSASSGTGNEDFGKEDVFMKKLFDIFGKHYADENCTLDHLCRLMGMSSSQLHRKLTALTDQSAMQMFRAFRLNKAHELLLTRRELNVSEIGLLVGFNNPAHFSRLFSKAYGNSPSALKNRAISS